MANWLSSKLKVAESLLQQIDQQAAESLRKNERSRSEAVNAELPGKSETVPLKDQLKKRNLKKESDNLPKILDSDNNRRKKRPEGIAKPRKPSRVPSNRALNDGDWTELLGSPKSISVLGKSDSTPDRYTANVTKRNLSYGLNQTDSFVGSGRKHTQIDSALLEAKKVLKQSSFCSTSVKGYEVLTQKKFDHDVLGSDFGGQGHGLFTSADEVFAKMDVESRKPETFSLKVSDGLDPSQRRVANYKQVSTDSLAKTEKDHIASDDNSSVDLRKHSIEMPQDVEPNISFENHNEGKLHIGMSNKMISSEGGAFQDQNENSSGERSDAVMLPSKTISKKSITKEWGGNDDAHVTHVKEHEALVNELPDMKIQANGDDNESTDGRGLSDLNVGDPILEYLQGTPDRLPSLPAEKMDPSLDGSSETEERSSSDTESESTSDSENEHISRREERKRKKRMIAEAAAARAIESIKEHENIVARFEGEKQSLEKILEEREKEQAQEASALQSNMEEVMEAVELEKQKHNSTRMEAMGRLAKLESTNAELARSLASTQWKLEKEVSRVTQLRQEVELKEVAQEDLKRRISTVHQNISSLNQLEGFGEVEFEREIREAEYTVTCDKIKWLEDKANMLEENIKTLRTMLEVPTELETELKRRLAELTDHLIHKQAQVEALNSEKATLHFRRETLSRSVEDQGLRMQSGDFASNSGTNWLDPVDTNDIEVGIWGRSNPKARLVFSEIESGKRHIVSIIRQLDAIFAAGAVFLRQNWTAQACGLFYLLCLHIWVLYILLSGDSDETRFGAVVSLESINKTSGV